MRTHGTAFLIVILTVFLLSGPSFAEYRVWTDRDGQKIEAQFVRMEVDTIVLRRTDESELKVSLDSLSDADRRYALLQVPPRIEMKVSMGVEENTIGYLGDRENSYRLKLETVNPEVALRKVSTVPYEAPLVLEVVVIGRMKVTDRYIILDHAVDSFTFNAENKGLHRFEGNPIDLEQVSGSLKSGIEYAGYLVAIRDHSGKIFSLKTSRSDFRKQAEALLMADTGSLFNENLKLIKPRRPDTGGGLLIPGRRF